jgi:regulator of protease activity HflC (stomatin/prohibitin superfamily)
MDDLSIGTVATIVIGVVLAIVVLIAIARTVRIVSQATAGIVERLGRYHRTLDPGLHFLFPFVDQLRTTVDLREQVVAFPPQPVITQDNVTISIDTVFYFTVTDPFRATYEVASLLTAVEQLTVTTLRNVIGSLSLEETLTSRDKINADLRIVLDEATERWGIRVNRIELKSIDPPGSIQEAMEKQMRAERDRRAVILNAEGIKQSQILTAEGEKQAAILTAEGEREAAILRAQGEAEATRQVFKAIHDGDPSPDLLTYQYIQNLPQVANGQGMTLLLVPSDAIGSMGAIAALGSALEKTKDASASGPA